MADIYPNLSGSNNAPNNNNSQNGQEPNLNSTPQNATPNSSQTEQVQQEQPNQVIRSDAPFITEMPEMPKAPTPPSVEPATVVTPTNTLNNPLNSSVNTQTPLSNMSPEQKEPAPLELDNLANPLSVPDQTVKNEPLILDTDANPVSTLADAEPKPKINQPQAEISQPTSPQSQVSQTESQPQLPKTQNVGGIELQNIPESAIKPVNDIPVQHNTPEIPRIRTYADDVKNAMAVDQVSMAKIAMAEQRRRETQQKVEEVSSRNPKNVALLIASLCIIILSAGVVWYFIFGSKPIVPNTIILTPNKNFIQYENKLSLDATNLNRSAIKNAIDQLKSQPFSLRSITAIEFSNNGATFETRHWLEQIGISVPDVLSRSLKPEFLYGIYSDEFGPSPFILMQVESFEQGYSGMLAWESEMATDIEGFIYKAKTQLESDPNAINQEISLATDSAEDTSTSTLTTTTQTSTSTSIQNPSDSITTQTSTSTTDPETSQSTSTPNQNIVPLNPPTNPLVERPIIPVGVFKDQVIANRDARVFETPEDSRLFFYAFVANDIIFIGQSEATLREVVTRYQREQQVR